MRATAAAAAGLAITLAGGCKILPRAEPVPVEGPRAQVDSLAGNWEGTYRASGASRHGILRFSLPSGSDTAYGEVEITFSKALRLYGDPAGEPMPRSPCRVLQIEFVRLDAGTIRGTLAPYWDPDCECRAVAVFDGRLIGRERVEGTFTSRRAPNGPGLLHGRWVAERR